MHDFIQKNKEKIIDEWISFAATLLPAAAATNHLALRDHIDEILDAICHDMTTPQNELQRQDKSKGLKDTENIESVGAIHARLRLEGGFRLDQLVAEYRALRACVLRLWAGEPGFPQHDINEITRFNEAIDEILAEATNRYMNIITHYRDEFIGILGHDLRSPLTSITMTAGMLAGSENIANTGRLAKRIQTSAERMNRMVRDLLDLTRGRLNGGIPVSTRPTDLREIATMAVNELSVAYPQGHINLELRGNLKGTWDPDRMAQVFSNLVANAVVHGSDKSIHIVIEDRGKDVEISVSNSGTIPSALIPRIFDPLVRESTSASSLGLGLYICKGIVEAHSGKITVKSENNITTFKITLPH